MPKLAFDVKVWPELDRLLDRALDLPVGERQVWLASLPPRHDAMKPHLATLLAHAERLETSDFLKVLPGVELADRARAAAARAGAGTAAEVVATPIAARPHAEPDDA
jgi:hypothetical protein